MLKDGASFLACLIYAWWIFLFCSIFLMELYSPSVELSQIIPYSESPRISLAPEQSVDTTGVPKMIDSETVVLKPSPARSRRKDRRLADMDKGWVYIRVIGRC